MIETPLFTISGLNAATSILLWIILVESVALLIQRWMIKRRDRYIQVLWDDIEETERQQGGGY